MELQQNCCRYLMDDGSQCSNVSASASRLGEQHADWLNADLEVYKAVTEHFRQDVREFWSRSSLYLIVQAGLFSVFVSLKPHASALEKAETISLGVLGLVLAVVWFLVARGSVVWIRRWRAQTIEIDNVVDRHHVYMKVEAFPSQNPLMSPSNITQYLPAFLCLGWAAMLFLLLLYP